MTHNDWNVTYEVWTEESAEIGETDERGFISEDVPLRFAIEDLLATRTEHVGGSQYADPSDSDVGQARWITVDNGMEYLTGAYESRSLHIPDRVTPASRARLVRLVRGDV